DPGDSRGLATAIRSLLERPEEARRFGNAGRERMQREFTAAVMAERTQEVYARALAARRRS
ncbi:MAG: glycosyltransferase, partial [Thermoleophilia bacterium]|nr:glycosyltransferase [Thermoleophilia bacterium]